MLATVVKRCTYPTSLLLTYMHVNICRSKAKVKKLPFYCIWGGLHGDLRILHLQLWKLYLAASDFDCLAFFSHQGWYEHKKLDQEAINLNGQGYILYPPDSYTHRHFSFHCQCFEHHAHRNLPLNTSLHIFLLPSPYQNRIANIG